MSGKPWIVWTEEMLAALRRLRTVERHPIHACAEAIGVSYETAWRKAHALGLSSRLNRGRTPGSKVRDDAA